MDHKEKNIAILSAVLLIIAAIFSTGFHQIDEHFQILEFAALKLGLTTPSELPWEFHERIRPAFQPLVVVLTFRFFSLFGLEDPFLVTTFLRIFSAAISWVAMCLIYLHGKTQFKKTSQQNIFLMMSFLSWFLFYNHVRFSSENWAGTFFSGGFFLFLYSDRKGNCRWFIPGLLLGVAFICRYQSAFLILGFLGWLAVIRRAKFRELCLMSSGILLVGAGGVIIDHWFYEGWTLTSWNYFQANILQDKISTFGVDPWWYYLKKGFEQLIPPFSAGIIFALFAYFVFNPRHSITWAVVPFLIIHLMITHKEMRFLYPLVGFLPIIIVSCLAELEKRGIAWRPSILRVLGRCYWAANLFFLLFVISQPAKGHIALYETIYRKYEKPVTLYFLGSDPYFEVCQFHFYSRPNLSTQPYNLFANASKEGEKVVLISRGLNEAMPKLDQSLKLIYSTYPEWLYPFHQRKWVGLGRSLFVYEVE